MTIENDFLPYGTAGGANVLSQTSYAGNASVPAGVSSGILPSNFLNKAIRQGSIAAYLIGQLIADETGQTAIDSFSGSAGLATLLANFKTAIGSVPIVGGRAPQVSILSGTGTYTTPTVNGALPLYLEVEMIGGGSGGGGAGTTTTGGAGGAGGNTTFGTALLVANGGPASPTSDTTTYPTPATATGSLDVVSGGLGGGSGQYVFFSGSSAVSPVNGGNGAGTFYGAGAPGGISNNGGSVVILPGTAVAPGSGGGGGAINVNTNAYTGWGGNAGAFLRGIITSPATTYAYAVGAAGAAGAAGTDGSAGSAGAGGYLRVVAYFL